MVPENMVKTFMAGIHGDMLSGHEGQFKTKESYNHSSGEAWTKTSMNFWQISQMSEKKKKHETKNTLIPLEQSSEHNQRVHMDLFCPLKTSENGKKFIMCITDAFSKLAKLIAIPDKCAKNIAEALYSK
jgi:hypothetical protein